MLTRALAVATVAMTCLATAAMPARAGTPLGLGLTEGGDAVIDIEPCGTNLCGRIAGIRLDHEGDPIPRDWKGELQCGLPIIRGARPAGNAWDGEIIDPRNGDRYNATLRVDAADRLHLRGYLLVPLLGQTQIWTRFDGPVAPDCRIPTEQAANAAQRSNHR